MAVCARFAQAAPDRRRAPRRRAGSRAPMSAQARGIERVQGLLRAVRIPQRCAARRTCRVRSGGSCLASRSCGCSGAIRWRMAPATHPCAGLGVAQTSGSPVRRLAHQRCAGSSNLSRDSLWRKLILGDARKSLAGSPLFVERTWARPLLHEFLVAASPLHRESSPDRRDAFPPLPRVGDDGGLASMSTSSRRRGLRAQRSTRRSPAGGLVAYTSCETTWYQRLGFQRRPGRCRSESALLAGSITPMRWPIPSPSPASVGARSLRASIAGRVLRHRLGQGSPPAGFANMSGRCCSRSRRCRWRVDARTLRRRPGNPKPAGWIPGSAPLLTPRSARRWISASVSWVMCTAIGRSLNRPNRSMRAIGRWPCFSTDCGISCAVSCRCRCTGMSAARQHADAFRNCVAHRVRRMRRERGRDQRIAATGRCTSPARSKYSSSDCSTRRKLDQRQPDRARKPWRL